MVFGRRNDGGAAMVVRVYVCVFQVGLPRADQRSKYPTVHYGRLWTDTAYHGRDLSERAINDEASYYASAYNHCSAFVEAKYNTR